MKFTRFFLAAAACLAALPVQVHADQDIGDQLGTIHFEVSGDEKAREHVVRGVKLLHHMMYAEADREFAAALSIDAECALAYWGRAMTLLHPLWPDAPNAGELSKGADFVKRGLACNNVTAREKAYLETMGVFYMDAKPEEYVQRLKALDAASENLAKRFPEDMDAQAFSALFHLAPARFQAKDKSNRLQIEAATQLENVLAKIPDHPGAQHYKIHALDFPMLADRALEVCEVYGGIAPDVPHALHMPTHIYTRRGLWSKSIEFNLRSAEAARKLRQKDGMLNSHLTHALDYLAYAYLQRGMYRDAERVREELATLAGPYQGGPSMVMAFAFSAVPARCALEQKRWGEAAELPLGQPSTFPWGEPFLNCESIIRFARAIGAARSGQLDAARAEAAELEKLHERLSALRRTPYWVSQAQTQLLAARAWIAHAEGDTDAAIAQMRRAADLEANTDKEAVTPGEVLPAGDLLGDLLLEANRPGEALEAFEVVLGLSPNRLNTLHGAAVSAEKAGDATAARRYYEQLLTVADQADPGSPQVEQARAYMTRLAVR